MYPRARPESLEIHGFDTATGVEKKVTLDDNDLRDLLIDGCGKDPEYNFYRHSGIGVVNPRGGNEDELPPADVRTLMP